MTAPRMRAGTADRQACVDRLTRHFTQGRLDPEEFDSRVAKAYAATYLDELPGLVADLPEDQWQRGRAMAGPCSRGRVEWAGVDGPARADFRRPPPIVAVVAVATVLAVVLMSLGAMTHGFFPFPLLWIGLILLFLTRGRRHHRGGNRTGFPPSAHHPRR